MTGFYLYCIRPRTRINSVRGKEKSNSEFSLEGIDGGKVFTIPHQDLEAIVSEVSLAEFGSEEIQKRAQEDLGWIKEKAQIHEKVIEEAMIGEDPLKNKNLKAVIPMKFGTIFKSKESLEETLKKHYDQFKESLKKIEGKQEWAVKVYLDRRAFEKEIKKVSPVVQEKEKEIAQLYSESKIRTSRPDEVGNRLPEGVAYFAQKQIDEAASKEADKALENYTESFVEALKKWAEVSTKSKILEKELTGKSLPMVLNAIFLVSKEKLENFIKEIDKLEEIYKSKGFNFEYSGPWPPYNFI